MSVDPQWTYWRGRRGRFPWWRTWVWCFVSSCDRSPGFRAVRRAGNTRTLHSIGLRGRGRFSPAGPRKLGTQNGPRRSSWLRIWWTASAQNSTEWFISGESFTPVVSIGSGLLQITDVLWKQVFSSWKFVLYQHWANGGCEAPREAPRSTSGDVSAKGSG